jgi:hypothetical protein
LLEPEFSVPALNSFITLAIFAFLAALFISTYKISLTYRTSCTFLP